MNILYTITWPASRSGDLPRQFFEQLREAVARGISIPFDCPYEVALMRAVEIPDATPPASAWAVTILAMRVTTADIGASEQTLPELENWFKQCMPEGIPPGSQIESAEASHLKLASELRSDYAVVANFGTFVGEPEMAAPPEPAKPEAPLSVETEALKTLVGQPLSPQAQKALAEVPSINPPVSLPLARAADTHTFSTCLGIGLLVSGVLLIPLSLLLGAFLALGQFSTDPTTADTTSNTINEFILLLACCPFPVLILGIGLIVLGIFIPRWMAKNQPRR